MILARLDITNEIGTGHFRRIHNLANYMEGIEFIFLIITDNEDNPLFIGRNFHFTTKKDEFNDFKALLGEYRVDIIILDLLHYEKGYIKNIKNITGKKIVSFHEYDDISKYSDLKINYNFIDGFEDIKDATYLAGYKYIIFNDEIAKYRTKASHDYVFVSFGGSDPSELTEMFIDKIANKLHEIKFIIHLGNFNHLDLNNKVVYKNVIFVLQPKNLFKYMAGARLAVISGGNMMYELMYLGVPCHVIAHNKHQSIFSLNASKYGGVNYLGLSNDIDYDKLIACIQNENNSSKYTCDIIDNNGKSRIQSAMLNLVLL